MTNKAVDNLDDIFKNNSLKPQSEFITPEGFRIKAQSNQFDDFEEIGNTFEMRAKKTLSGVAPEDQVVNVLKNEFKPVDYQFGGNTIKLSRTEMKHILQRHHPEFWDGSIKRTQSYFATKTTIGELQNVVMNVLKQNRIKLIKEGNRANLQITGIVDGVEYALGINRGQVKQLYIPKN